MSITLTYHVELDRDDDGNFTSDEALTSAIVAAHWRRGMPHAHATTAQTGRATLMVDGARQTLADSANLIGKRLRIRAHRHDASSGTSDDVTLFMGWVSALDTSPEHITSDLYSGTWALIVQDAWALLADERVQMPRISQQTTGAMMAHLLAQIMARPFVMAGRWLVGRSTHGRLDAIRLGDAALPMALDDGQTVCQVVGVDWGAGVPLTAALRQLADAERGRVFAGRDGRITFYGRHRLLQGAPQITLADTMQSVHLRWGVDNVAAIEVTCQPQRIGAADTPLWIASQPIRLRPLSDTPLMLPYQDEYGQPCGAWAVQAPQAGVHYHINRHADGSGADVTQHIRSTWTSSRSAAHWVLHNPLPDDVYVQVGAMVRGTPLSIANPMTVRVGSHARRVLYGGKTHHLHLPAVDDIAFAHDIARYEAARHMPQQGRVQQVTVDAHHLPAALDADLCTRVRVTTTTPAHADDYLIYAADHHINAGGSQHRIVWHTEAANPAQFWLVAAGRLDATTALAL